MSKDLNFHSVIYYLVSSETVKVFIKQTIKQFYDEIKMTEGYNIKFYLILSTFHELHPSIIIK